jgi:hypothetical protein
MILDGHKEDPWAECVAASWVFSQGLLKFGLTGRPTFQKSSSPPADKTPNRLLANNPNGS